MRKITRLPTVLFLTSAIVVSALSPAFAWRRGPIIDGAAVPVAPVVLVPAVLDVDPYVPLQPCTLGSFNCIAVVHSVARADCAVSAVTGRGLSARQMVFEIRVALARGCADAAVSGPAPVVARF